jgi:hypothetical protein
MSDTATPETDSAFVDLSESKPAPAVEAAPPAAEPPALDPDWEHERLEFYGDDLAVRVPTQQALAGFSLASSKYVPSDVKNDMTGLFLTEHLGPQTYGRIMQRLMDGDDPDYTVETIGQMMREIVMLGVNAQNEAAADPA